MSEQLTSWSKVIPREQSENLILLVDLLLKELLGTVTQLGEMERSAPAKVDNVMVSHFLNSLAALAKKGMQPSPPLVVVNKLNLAPNAINEAMATVSDHSEVYEAAFWDSEKVVLAHFQVLPTPSPKTKAKEPKSEETRPVLDPLALGSKDQEKRKICLIHGRPPARAVLTRALSSKLKADVASYSCCEDVMAGSLDYDTFIVYNNLKSRKIGGVGCVRKIRALKPEAHIIAVSTKPYGEKRFLPAGANNFLLRAGNEIEEMIKLVLQRNDRSSKNI